MPTPDKLMHNILSDMNVKLASEFHKNFSRKGFFTKKWPDRKNTKALGSLMTVTGVLRGGIKSRVLGNGVEFSSDVPYAAKHNEGGTYHEKVREHTRRNKKTGKSYRVKSFNRTVIMPRRRFIGESPEVRHIIGDVIAKNATRYFTDLAKKIRK